MDFEKEESLYPHMPELRIHNDSKVVPRNENHQQPRLERNFGIEIRCDGDMIREPHITIRDIKTNKLIYAFPIKDARWRAFWGDIQGDINDQVDLIAMFFRNSIYRLIAGKNIKIEDIPEHVDTNGEQVFTRKIDAYINWGDIGGDINNQTDLQKLVYDNSINRLEAGRLVTLDRNADGVHLTINVDVDWQDIKGDINLNIDLINLINKHSIDRLQAGRLITLERLSNGDLKIHTDVNWGDIGGDIELQADLIKLIKKHSIEQLRAGENITITVNPDGTRTISARNINIFELVETLPETGSLEKIYLIADGSGGFEQWGYVNGKWKLIGSMKSSDLTISWGDIVGDIQHQTDLVDLINATNITQLRAGNLITLTANANGTKTITANVDWGDIGGDIKNQKDLVQLIGHNSIFNLHDGLNTKVRQDNKTHVDVDLSGLQGQIDDIRDSLLSIEQQRTITLVENVDYRLTYFNNVAPSNPSIRPIITAQITQFSTVIYITAQNVNTALTCPNADLRAVSSISNIIGTPNAWLFGINFMGAFEVLNATPASAFIEIPAVWTPSPNTVAIRANWFVRVEHAYDRDRLSGTAFVFAAQGLQDGYPHVGNGNPIYARYPNVTSISTMRVLKELRFNTVIDQKIVSNRLD